MAQNSNSALQAIGDQAPTLIPSQSEWSLMMDMAKVLVPTGFLPDSIKTPEQAVAIVLKGRELRIPAMYALAHINIIKSKPSTDSELMLALIHRDHGQRALRIASTDDGQCTAEYRLTGWADVQTFTFTIEQAKQAQLMSNPSWGKYPAAMLRARCISAVGRMAFPASIGGMYVAGELGEDVAVMDDGEVVSVSAVIVNHPANQQSGPPPLEALEAWAGDIGLGIEDLNAAATFLRKQESDVTTMTDRDLVAVQSKLVAAYQKDRDKFFAWIQSLQPVDASEPIDIEPRPVTTEPPTADEMDAALASATPTSLPFDVPSDRYTRT